MAEAVCGKDRVERSAMSDLKTNPESTSTPTPDPAPSTPEFAVATQPSYARTVFLGPDGLRPGWGLAFYVAMFYPLQFVVSRWTSSLELNGLWSLMLEEFGVLLAAVVPSLVLAGIEKRPWGVYGL